MTRGLIGCGVTVEEVREQCPVSWRGWVVVLPTDRRCRRKRMGLEGIRAQGRGQVMSRAQDRQNVIYLLSPRICPMLAGGSTGPKLRGEVWAGLRGLGVAAETISRHTVTGRAESCGLQALGGQAHGYCPWCSPPHLPSRQSDSAGGGGGGVPGAGTLGCFISCHW